MSDLAATNCGCECGNGDNGCGSLIWILLLLCCCGGNNGSFLSNGSGCDNILPLLLILCCCGNGNGCFWSFKRAKNIFWKCAGDSETSGFIFFSGAHKRRVRELPSPPFYDSLPAVSSFLFLFFRLPGHFFPALLLFFFLYAFLIYHINTVALSYQTFHSASSKKSVFFNICRPDHSVINAALSHTYIKIRLTRIKWQKQ